MAQSNVQFAQTLIDSDIDVRACIRGAAGQRGQRMPVRVVDGSNRAPTLEGEGGYWTTPSGLTRVRHPNAYGWRTVYHCSTWRIEVGAGWVRRHCPIPWHAAQRGALVCQS